MGIPSHIVDDLSSRFLVNLPEDQRSDPIRVCFQAELAHWFYIDWYCNDKNKYPQCKEIGVREFIRVLFNHVDFLLPQAEMVDVIIDEWRQYKSTVPTYGAMLLDETMEYVLLVQGFYARNSWGFPKGKVNEDEDPSRCAVREVFEETGFNMDGLLNAHQFIRGRVGDNLVQLYVVPGVPKHFDFAPRTRNEIRKIQWFRVSDLPTHKNDQTSAALGIYPNHFFSVFPFVEDLRKWIRRRGNQSPQKQNRRSAFRRYSPPDTTNYPNLPPRLQRLQAAKHKSDTTPPAAKHKSETPPAAVTLVYAAKDNKTKTVVEDHSKIKLAKAWTNVQLDWKAIL